MAVNFTNTYEIKKLLDWLLHLPVLTYLCFSHFWSSGVEDFLNDSVYCAFLCCLTAHQSVGKLGRWPPDLHEDVAKYQEVS